MLKINLHHKSSTFDAASTETRLDSERVPRDGPNGITSILSEANTPIP
jgi:hypothetical protein